MSLVLAALAGLPSCIRVVTPAPDPSESTAIAPVLIQFDNGTLEVSENDVDRVAKYADLTPEDIKAVGLKPQAYTRAELETLLADLRTTDENYFLELFGRGAPPAESTPAAPSPAVPAPPTATPPAPEPAPPSQAVPKRVSEQPAWDASTRATVVRVLKRMGEDKLAKDVANGIAGTFELWQVREKVIRATTAKDTTRSWVLSRIAESKFEEAVNVTIDAASSDGIPIMMAERGFITVATDRLPLKLKSRDCSDALTACRFVFSHSNSTWSSTWTDLFKTPQPAEQELVLEVMVGGTLLKKNIPLEYVSIENKVTNDVLQKKGSWN